jgi:hypothetical protein
MGDALTAKDALVAVTQNIWNYGIVWLFFEEKTI